MLSVHLGWYIYPLKRMGLLANSVLFISKLLAEFTCTKEREAGVFLS